MLLDDRQIEVERRNEGFQRARMNDYSEAVASFGQSVKKLRSKGWKGKKRD